MNSKASRLFLLFSLAVGAATGAFAYHDEMGPDRPPEGRSLFDHLFGTRAGAASGHDVPFPFERLLAAVAVQTQADDVRFGFRTVRIPVGRGLHSQAAAPDFFASPTVVAGLDAPVLTSGEYSSLELRDRLFFSYQPRSQTLEVISYNEDAGRFEFQIVRDYGPDVGARVFYARRALCLSCHHNGGPIFSAPVYQETDVNALIAARLHDNSLQNPAAVDLSAGMGSAFAIAASASRMEYVPAWQRLWRDGCEADDPQPVSIKCRSAAYLLGLQYRLSGLRGFERDAVRYRRYVVPTVMRQVRNRWPHGMTISSSRIPDRAPLAKPALSDSVTGRVEGRAIAGLPVHQDPLTPRRFAALWPLTDERGVERLIEGIGQMIPLQHARELDEALERHDAWRGLQRTTQDTDCDVLIARRFAKFTCGSQRTDDAGDFGMVVSVYLDEGRVTGASVAGLKLQGQFWRSALDLPSPSVEKTIEGWKIVSRVLQPFTGISARRANGVRLDRLTLTWTDGGSAESQGPPSTARASLLLVDDFDLVVKAIARFEAAAQKGSHDLLSSGAFRPARLQRKLMQAITGIAPQPCCDDVSEWPAIELDPVGSLLETDLIELAAQAVPIREFVALCGDCHQSPTDYPPGFLFGPAKSVRETLETCAQRIWMRLRVLGMPPGQRPLSAMPPPEFLHSRSGGELAEQLDQLERYAQGVARRQLEPDRSVDDLFAAGYQNAVQCRRHN